jgi:hypothetical protein
LGVLRMSDYTLVVGCGLGAFGILPDLISSTAHGRWAEVVVEGLMAATMAFAAYTGWRHVGIIDPRVWRSYLRVFPALAGVGALISLATAIQWSSSGKNPLEDLHLLMSFFGGLWFAGLAIPGFVCVMLLRRMRVAPMGVPLGKLLTGLIERGGEEAPRITRVERPRFRRGVVFAALGACVLLATTLAPVPVDSRTASAFYKVTLQLNTLAFFLIVRARRHFQVSADSLLAVDKRPPILFLRSFTDDEWQARVLGWMESASLIVMYCGKTKWVNWELQKIIERGRSTSLILMLPEVKGWRASKRRKDIAERIQQLREAFRSTRWIEDLTEFNDFLGLRAMLFRADGSMVMVRSRSRSRDSYHLAALIAHQQLLDPMPALEPAAARVAERMRHTWRWIGASVVGTAAVLVAALFYIGVSNEPSRLAFKKGELYYAKPVTEAEAGRVGQFLLDREFFSDGKALTVRLDRNEARYQLQFVINPSYADDLIFATQLGVMGHDISRDVLGGKPLDVLLSDNRWKPLRAVPASAKLTFGRGELYYTDPVTAEQARAVGDLLHKFGFFTDDRSVSVHLGREQNIYQIRFVINRSGVDDPSVVKDFRVLARAVAEQALGNEPVMLHLCDEELQTLKRERILGQ